MKNLVKTIYVSLMIACLAGISLSANGQTYSYAAGSGSTKNAVQAEDMTIDGKTFEVFIGSRGGKYIQYQNTKGNDTKFYISGENTGKSFDNKTVYKAEKRDGTEYSYVIGLSNTGFPKKLKLNVD